MLKIILIHFQQERQGLGFTFHLRVNIKIKINLFLYLSEISIKGYQNLGRGCAKAIQFIPVKVGSFFPKRFFPPGFFQFLPSRKK